MAPMTEPESCIAFQMGDPYAPSSPSGRDNLEVFGDGRVVYRNQRVEQVSAATAQLTAVATHKLFAALAASPFPQWTNTRPLLPGTPMIQLTARLPSGEATAQLDYDNAVKTPGYDDLVRMLAAWSGILRTPAARRLASADLREIVDLPATPAVQDS